jgi:hypothetical protein
MHLLVNQSLSWLASVTVGISSCPALPCPALPCPALPCPALPCPALPCPALPCPQHHRRVHAFTPPPSAPPPQNTGEDQEYFKRLLAELATRHSITSAPYEELFVKRTILWGDFLRPGADREERVYEEAADLARVARLLEDYLEEFNTVNKSPLNLGEWPGHARHHDGAPGGAMAPCDAVSMGALVAAGCFHHGAAGSAGASDVSQG